VRSNYIMTDQEKFTSSQFRSGQITDRIGRDRLGYDGI